MSVKFLRLQLYMYVLLYNSEVDDLIRFLIITSDNVRDPYSYNEPLSIKYSLSVSLHYL